MSVFVHSEPLTGVAKQIYRVRKTLFKLLKKRGYAISKVRLNETRAEFKANFGPDIKRDDTLTISVVREDDETDKCLVFFIEDEKPTVGVKPLKRVAERLAKFDSDEKKSAIIIVEHGLSAMAVQAMQGINDMEGFSMEYFKECELLVDITEHVLVPEHQVMTSKEKQVLLERYKLKDTQLPRIQITDPVARYFGLKKGQVVRIIRESETAGRYVTYRICVDA